MAAQPVTATAEYEAAYALLAFCTRAIGSPAYYAALRERVAHFTAWSQIPVLAEQHGIAPLFYHHLKTAEIPIPADVELTLKGMIMRNRRYTQTFAAATAEIVRAFAAADVPMLVLKGIALATLVYPDPMLRPTTDIDLLISARDTDRALHILRGLGYSVPPQFDPKVQITRSINGITVPVDLQLYDSETVPTAAFWSPLTNPFVGFSSARMAFDCGGVTGYTIGRDEMLIFLSRHLAKHVLKGGLRNPVRLIWIADLVSYAECFGETLDWDMIHRIEPRLPGRLSACAALSDPAGVIPRPHSTQWYYQGWLHRKRSDAARVGLSRFIRDTMFPSAWWLRVYYGSPQAYPPLWALWMHHLQHVFAFSTQRIMRRSLR
jgi:hypothetical protein